MKLAKRRPILQRRPPPPGAFVKANSFWVRAGFSPRQAEILRMFGETWEAKPTPLTAAARQMLCGPQVAQRGSDQNLVAAIVATAGKPAAPGPAAT